MSRLCLYQIVGVYILEQEQMLWFYDSVVILFLSLESNLILYR